MFKRIARKAALESGHARHLHGQADRRPGRQFDASACVASTDAAERRLFADEQRARHADVPPFHGRPAEICSRGHAAVCAEREFVPTHSAHTQRSRQRRVVARQPLLRPARAEGRARRTQRVENRLPGADANPYLAIAATLLCGYLGVEERLERSPEALGNAYLAPSTLPRSMPHGLERLAACEPMRLLGEDFS